MPALLTLVLFAFVLYCVLDVALTDATRVRGLPKPAWLVVVIFLPVVGSIAWLLGGRPERSGSSPGGGTTSPGGSSPRGSAPRGPVSGGPRSRPGPRPRGPDDDPEFLRRVQERLRRDDGGRDGTR